MNFTRNDIATLATNEGVTELEMVTMLQTGAAASGNDAALEALCDIKSEILGL